MNINSYIENLAGTIKIDNNIVSFNVVNNTINPIFSIPSDLGTGVHSISISISNKENTYTIKDTIFTVEGESVIYVSSSGSDDSDGSDPNFPTTWDHAMEIAINGSTTIVLQKGEYGDKIFNTKDITTSGLTIRGEDTVTLKGSDIYSPLLFTIAANNIILENLTFDNARVEWSGNCGKINNITFQNLTNNVPLTITGSHMSVSNSTFKENTHYLNYDGIYATGNYLTIENTQFINNTQRFYIVASYGTDAILRNLTFKNNQNYQQAGDVGRLLRLDGARSELLNSKFENNNIKDYLIYIFGGTTIFNTTFSNNTGIGCIIGRCNVVDCEFINETVSNGVLYPYNNLNVSNSRFINNTKDISPTMGSITLNNNLFIGKYMNALPNPLLSTINLYSNNNMTVKIMEGNKLIMEVTIPANTTSTTFQLPTLGEGIHKLNITVNDDNNTYINNVLSEITVIDKIYVSNSSSDDGNGTQDNPTSWNNAMEMAVPGSTIVLLEGTYDNILNQEINIAGITISGENNVILDAKNNPGYFFNIISDYVTLDNLIFKNGNLNTENSFVTINGQNCILNNTKFYNNIITATSETTSSVSIAGSNNKVLNSIFENNTAKTPCAGIMVTTTSQYNIIDNCTFNNNSGRYGVDILFRGTNNIINNSNFKNTRYAPVSGYTVYAYSVLLMSNDNVYNSNFTNTDKEVAYIDGNNIILDNIRFNNILNTYAVYDYRTCNNITLKNSKFNSSSIYIRSTSYNIINCTFENAVSTKSTNGGAIYMESGSVIIRDSRFINLLLSMANCHAVYESYCTDAMTGLSTETRNTNHSEKLLSVYLEAFPDDLVGLYDHEEAVLVHFLGQLPDPVHFLVAAGAEHDVLVISGVASDPF